MLMMLVWRVSLVADAHDARLVVLPAWRFSG